MHLDILFVLSNLLGLFLLMGIGYACLHWNILPQNAMQIFSALLMDITLPCTCFITLASRTYDAEFLKSGIIIVIIGFLVYGLSLAADLLLTRPLKIRRAHRGLWAFAATFPNNGFMGYPIILALTNEEGLALAVIFAIPFTVICYIFGALAVSRDNEDASTRLSLRSILVQPVNLAIVLSIVFYLGQIPIAEPVRIAVTNLSNVTTPLSMMVCGMALSRSTGRSLLTDRDAYTCTVMRLILSPLITIAALKLFSFPNPLIVPVVIITMAMPCAGVTTLYAEIYHSDTDFAAKVSFLTNAAALLTIPLICMLL